MRTMVVLVNHKGARDTANCLRSLSACPIPPEVVVVDNTPDDPELEPALAEYPNMRLILAPENLGFGRGNNLGIDWALGHTDCEFIFVLNNDATVEPDSIIKLEEAMDAHPEAGIVTPRIVLAEDLSRLWYGGGEVDWRRGGGRVPGFLGSADAPLAMQSRYVSFASACAMFIRRRVIEDCGGFDPRYFMYEEDLELCLRVNERGWCIWYEPSALVVHKGQGSLRREQGGGFFGAWAPENPNLPFYVYHINRNRLLTMKQHAHGLNRCIFLWYFPFFVAVKAFRFVKHRRWSALAAMFHGWRAYRHTIAGQDNGKLEY